jgi:hypothetical protein
MLKIVLAISRMSNTEVILFVKSLQNRIGKVPFFGNKDAQAQLGKVVNCAEVLEVFHTEDSSKRALHMRTAREALDRELKLYINLLEFQLNNEDQTAEDAAPMLSEIGLRLKAQKHTSPRIFSVLPGDTVGSVKLKAAGKASMHQWQYTSDIKTYGDRINLEPTTVATTEVNGLESGVYAFFHKAHRKGETTKWEGPVLFFVSVVA